MQLNWITVGIIIIVALIAYTGYKVFKVMKTLKTQQVTHQPRQETQQPLMTTQPPKPQAQPKPQSVPVTQPKLSPPSFMRKPIQRQEESDEESEIETEMFNLNDETEFNDQQPEMIIPLNLNNIIKQVVNQKMVEHTSPNTIIREIGSEESDMSIHEETNSDTESSKQSSPKNSLSKDSIEHSSLSLNKMTIAELKELAKKNNIKLTEGGKPKNKETLLKELSGL